jgi:hypothetical protein
MYTIPAVFGSKAAQDMTLGYLFSFENCDDEKIRTAITGDDGDMISSHPFISKDRHRPSSGEFSKKSPGVVN